jgi:hypothetical protein
MTKFKPETVLNEFLRTNGISLASGGSAEFAVDLINARAFIEMLDDLGGNPLGIEVWRWVAGDLAIQSLDGWYSESGDPQVNIESAKEFIFGPSTRPGDLYSIQYDCSVCDD